MRTASSIAAIAIWYGSKQGRRHAIADGDALLEPSLGRITTRRVARSDLLQANQRLDGLTALHFVVVLANDPVFEATLGCESVESSPVFHCGMGVSPMLVNILKNY